MTKMATLGFGSKWPLSYHVFGLELSPAECGCIGNFTMDITPLLNVGGHTIVVSEKTDKGLIQDASTFMLTVDDKADNK